MNDQYSGPERRMPPEPTHVSVDYLSAETKSLINRWLGMGLGGLVLTIVGSAFALGVYVTELTESIDRRPTLTMTRVMIDSVKSDILTSIAAQEIRTDGVLEVLGEHTRILEQLQERSEAIRRTNDRQDEELRSLR